MQFTSFDKGVRRLLGLGVLLAVILGVGFFVVLVFGFRRLLGILGD